MKAIALVVFLSGFLATSAAAQNQQAPGATPSFEQRKTQQTSQQSAKKPTSTGSSPAPSSAQRMAAVEAQVAGLQAGFDALIGQVSDLRSKIDNSGANDRLRPDVDDVRRKTDDLKRKIDDLQDNVEELRDLNDKVENLEAFKKAVCSIPSASTGTSFYLALHAGVFPVCPLF